MSRYNPIIKLLLILLSLSAIGGQSFEVASIRASPPYPVQGGVSTAIRGGPGTEDPSHIRWSFASLRNIVDAAYAIRPNQVTGPSFLDTLIFDITATVPEGTARTQVREMWRNLLVERFGMVARVERKEFDGEQLEINRGGHKLQGTKLPDAEQPERPTIENGILKGPGFAVAYRNNAGTTTATVMAKAQSLSGLVNLLVSELDEPVIDKTGLSGKYDFEFDFTPRSLRVRTAAAVPPMDTNVDIVSAIDQYLGLRISKTKIVMDHVVIEKIDRKPTEN